MIRNKARVHWNIDALHLRYSIPTRNAIIMEISGFERNLKLNWSRFYRWNGWLFCSDSKLEMCRRRWLKFSNRMQGMITYIKSKDSVCSTIGNFSFCCLDEEAPQALANIYHFARNLLLFSYRLICTTRC